MRVPVHCTRCRSIHRADLRDLPDDLLVCPLCEHEARLSEGADPSGFEQSESRRRLLTAVGAGCFALAAALVAAHAALSDAHPGEPLFGPALLGAAGTLGLVALVATVLQESKATINHF